MNIKSDEKLRESQKRRRKNQLTQIIVTIRRPIIVGRVNNINIRRAMTMAV